MTYLYDPVGSDPDASFQYLVARGRSALGRGDAQTAIRLLFAALRQTHVNESDYARAAAVLRDAFVRRSLFREALTAEWYRGATAARIEVEPSLLERAAPVDRARTLLANDEARRAAETFESAGLLVRAAVAYERAGDWQQARALWSRLAQTLASPGGPPDDLYAAGLAQFNLFRTSRRVGDARAARAAATAAVHLFEQAADRLESAGLRERAFDCFQVLISLGRETRVFEHVLEGYVNVLRILQEDHLRNYALQTFEEAVVAARNEGEFVAAATLAREMAAYARKQGEAAVANHAVATEASLWRAVAKATRERGGPEAVAENALLAAVVAFGELGQYAAVGRLYGDLAELTADEQRRAHYTRARARYEGARDESIEALPLAAHLRHETGFPDVWHVDLIEWEQRGSASEACADVLLDPSSTEVTRRRALLARLVALAAEAEPQASRPALLLCRTLAHLELYVILAPLEALARRPEPSVRAAAVEALSRFLFKRTFVTVRAALADPHGEVVRAAVATLEQLRFTQAFDPLARIYRETHTPAVRYAALRALARIELVEAAELLLDVLSFGSPDERREVVAPLKDGHCRVFDAVAARVAHDPKAPAYPFVREILRSRDVAS